MSEGKSPMATATLSETKPSGFVRELGLFDSTTIVVGSMIGSGIFIVSADIARKTGSTGGLLAAWIISGLMTVAAALSYGELAAMMPKAGGQYIYLREAYSPLWGFLYGWTLFLVIQTGTIAAVAVGFARFLGVLWPAISPNTWIVPPIQLSSGYAVSLSGAAIGRAAVDRVSDAAQYARIETRQADPECIYVGEDAGAGRINFGGSFPWAQRRRDSREFLKPLGRP